MTPPSFKTTSIALALAAIIVSPVFAAPYKTGDAVESFKAADQHEKAFTLNPSETRFLLVSHDMATGKMANAVLTTLGNEFLDSKKAVYMANIHGMPSVGRWFALPKMKKYAHRIILGDDAELITKFPEQAGKVTILKLSQGKVQSVSYWNPGDEALEALLK